MPRFMVHRKCSQQRDELATRPEQPACGGLPVDRTGLPEGGLYVPSSCARGSSPEDC